jgi:hypothetical protein
MVRLSALALALGLVLLPGCGAATLLAPLIEKAIDDIFDNGQAGDLIKDTTEIGRATELEIAFGGRYCCDPANGVDQRVTVVTIRHTGPSGSDPISYQFVPEAGSRLSAIPATGTLSRGEVQLIEIFASDCGFEFDDFRMRVFFEGDEGVPGRSTTTLITVNNVCSDTTPAVVTTGLLSGGTLGRSAYADALTLVEYGEAVQHGDVRVPDKVPSIALSEISYYGMVRLALDASALDDLFTGASASFPVGDGANGRILEGETTAPMAAGDYLVGVVALDGLFELIDTSREWRFGLCFDSDGNPANDYAPPSVTANDPTRGTDRWYFVDFAPGDGWSLRLIDSDGNEQATAARTIQFGNLLAFVIPAGEIPGPGAGYRAFTFTHTGDFGLGVARDWSGDHHPVSGLAAVPD